MELPIPVRNRKTLGENVTEAINIALRFWAVNSLILAHEKSSQKKKNKGAWIKAGVHPKIHHFYCNSFLNLKGDTVKFCACSRGRSKIEKVSPTFQVISIHKFKMASISGGSGHGGKHINSGRKRKVEDRGENKTAGKPCYNSWQWPFKVFLKTFIMRNISVTVSSKLLFLPLS